MSVLQAAVQAGINKNAGWSILSVSGLTEWQRGTCMKCAPHIDVDGISNDAVHQDADVHGDNPAVVLHISAMHLS